MPAGRISEYRLTPAAHADLEGIWTYTAETWSADQAERYVAGLFAVLEGLCTYPEVARERTEFTPPVRLHRHRSHLVIYRIEAGYLAILRIVHVRQHWQALLGDDPV